MSKQRKISRREGDVVAVPLGDGCFGYGRVLRDPLVAFYELRTKELATLDDVLAAPVAFRIFVMNYAITDGIWMVIGTEPLDELLKEEPAFFKKDPITGELSIYHDNTGHEFAAAREDCESLECAAVWEPDHVVERLNDFFQERANKWVESMRP